MKNATPTGQTGYVAASAADREPDHSALPRNPLVAIATALIGPLLGLFRRRGTPTAVESTRLEHYRSTPISLTHPGRNKDQARITQGSNNDAPERRSVTVRAYTRSAPAGRTASRKGGCSHG